MLDIYERSFIADTKEAKELNAPKIDGRDAKLFRGLTQENTEMDRRVSFEALERKTRDNELEEEMHSFGMVSCGLFDRDLKAIRVTIPDAAVLQYKCKGTNYNGYSPTDATGEINLQAGTVIWLKPIGFIYKSGNVKGVGAAGFRMIDGGLFSIGITYTDTFQNSLLFSLASAFATSVGFRFPLVTADPASYVIDLKNLEGFK